MMRSFGLVLVELLALSSIGCSSEFKNERQELAYLESLSNPTPTQWRRREDLREKKKTWPPELQSVVTITNYHVLFPYATLEAFRKDQAIKKAGTWRDVAASERAGYAVLTPEYEAVSKLCITTLYPGSKVRVLEIGDDYVHVEFVADEHGNPVTPASYFKGHTGHGYTEKWWDK